MRRPVQEAQPDAVGKERRRVARPHHLPPQRALQPVLHRVRKGGIGVRRGNQLTQRHFSGRIEQVHPHEPAARIRRERPGKRRDRQPGAARAEQGIRAHGGGGTRQHRCLDGGILRNALEYQVGDGNGALQLLPCDRRHPGADAVTPHRTGGAPDRSGGSPAVAPRHIDLRLPVGGEQSCRRGTHGAARAQHGHGADLQWDSRSRPHGGAAHALPPSCGLHPRRDSSLFLSVERS